MGETENAARIVRCWAQRWQSGGRAAAARLPAWTPEAAYLVSAGVLFFTSSRLACLAQFSEGEQGSANLEYLAASHFDRALLHQSIATQCEVLRGHLLEGGGCRRLCSSLLHGLPAYLDGPAVQGRMDFECPRPSLPGRARPVVRKWLSPSPPPPLPLPPLPLPPSLPFPRPLAPSLPPSSFPPSLPPSLMHTVLS